MLLLLLALPLLALSWAVPALRDLGRHAPALLWLWGAAHAAYLAAASWTLRHPHRDPRPDGTLRIVLGVGFLARLVLIPVAPTLSEDAYRYLWDGRLVAHGVNPYPHAPSDPALARFHDELAHRLNHPEVRTIYPPAAQALFGAAAFVSPSVVAWKIALLLLEFLLVAAVLGLLRRRGLAGERILLYYWNPLVLVESFGSGHVDLAAAAFLAAALVLYETRRSIPAGLAFGIAVMTKYVPAAVAPWFLRRRAWALLAAAATAAVLLAIPFLGAGATLLDGLRIYARHWEFNGLLYRMLRHLSDSEIRIRIALAAAGAAATLAIAWRARTATGAAIATTTALLLVSPTAYPWYVIPAVAFLPLHPDLGVRVFSGLVALSYLPLRAYRETGVWSLPGWILWVEYGGLGIAWAWTWIRGRSPAAERPWPAPVRGADQERTYACTSDSTPT